MPAPLSLDLRHRIFDAARTATAAQVASRFRVSVATVERLRKLHRETDALAPKPHGGAPPRLVSDDDRPTLDAYLAENPSMPHAVIVRRFADDTGRTVSPSTIRRVLVGWQLTRKKSP